jgi:hypothetical protein
VGSLRGDNYDEAMRPAIIIVALQLAIIGMSGSR